MVPTSDRVAKTNRVTFSADPLLTKGGGWWEGTETGSRYLRFVCFLFLFGFKKIQVRCLNEINVKWMCRMLQATQKNIVLFYSLARLGVFEVHPWRLKLSFLLHAYVYVSRCHFLCSREANLNAIRRHQRSCFQFYVFWKCAQICVNTKAASGPTKDRQTEKKQVPKFPTDAAKKSGKNEWRKEREQEQKTC